MIFWSIYLFFVPLIWVIYFDNISRIFKSKTQNKIDIKEDNKPDKREYINTFSNLVLFAVNGALIGFLINEGYTKVYSQFNFNVWETAYLIISFFAILGINDVYFYLSHRLLHSKLLFKHVHRVHHESHNTNAWATFSFHPIEGLIQISIIPIVIFLFPIQLYVLIFFATFLMFMSVYGHCGFELRPNKNSGLLVFNTSFHHYQHHKFVNYNFGLYLNFWDKIFRTNKPGYFEDLKKLGSRITKKNINA